MYLGKTSITLKQKQKNMNWKIKSLILATVFTFSFAVGANMIVPSLQLPAPVSAETIEVSNPLGVDNVKDLSSQIQKYLLMIVGGIAIIFIAVSGILYIIGGATGNDGMVDMAKKGLMGAIAGLVIVIGAQMILSEIYFIVLGKELDFNNLSASQILMRLINFLLAIVGTLFLISMITGGIWYFAAGGDESKTELGKKTVRYSIIGITIAIAAMVVLRQIDKIITGG